MVKFEALINLKYKYITYFLFNIPFNFDSFLANYTTRFNILCNSQDTHEDYGNPHNVLTRSPSTALHVLI